ncbi:MAG: DUF885 domain-containing protein [Sphingomonadaceae bacterium]|nr:DUF885 domain-containing protein [Sphingomonadaceae bacterium]
MNRILLLASPALLALASPGLAQQPAPAPPAAAENPDAALAAFFETYDQAQLARSPLSKSYRGVRDADYGRWDDFSDAAAIVEHHADQAALAEMRARFDPSALSPESRLSFRLFERQIERSDRAFAFRGNGYVFDQMNGAQSELPAFLINIHRISNAAEAEAYASRLENLGTAFDQLIAEADRRAEAGLIPPRWVFPYVLSDSRNVVTGAPFGEGPDAPLWADFQAKVNALEIPQAEKDVLLARGRAALVDVVGPAYQRLIATLARHQTQAPTDDGVWRLADGAEYYAERLSNYTTTDLTADRIHQIGLDEIARIHREMEGIKTRVGFEGTLPQFFAHLREGEQYYYATRAEYLAAANAAIDAMRPRLPEFFGRLPQAPLVVREVEPFREESAGKAFYNSPAPDGSRPGTYYVNLFNLRDMSRTELEALAFHEGIPGHHLQRALQTESTGLPPFRRFGGFTAYTEGWGLYAEELAKEMGFYADPYADFGRLGMELWRAARLVVDTGIHHLRWTRERAIQYLAENTPNPPGDIEKAIERYIVYPGQATAYMIGKLRIMELRESARTRLGDRFDIREFHDTVLGAGPVPLDVLGEVVDQWVVSRHAAN